MILQLPVELEEAVILCVLVFGAVLLVWVVLIFEVGVLDLFGVVEEAVILCVLVFGAVLLVWVVLIFEVGVLDLFGVVVDVFEVIVVWVVWEVTEDFLLISLRRFVPEVGYIEVIVVLKENVFSVLCSFIFHEVRLPSYAISVTVVVVVSVMVVVTTDRVVNEVVVDVGSIMVV